MQTNDRRSVGLLFIAALLASTPLRLFSFVLIIFVVAQFVKLYRGLLSRLIVSYLLLSAAITLLAAAAWLGHIELTSGRILYPILGSLLGTIIYQQRAAIPVSPQPRLSIAMLDSADILPLLVAIAAIIILILPFYPRISFANLAPTVMQGGDNSAHLELIKGNDFNRGYSIGDYGNRFNLASNLNTYPQGWHFNAAYTKWLVETMVPISQSANRILLFYYGYSLLWFGLLCFMLTRLALTIQVDLVGRRLLRWAKLGPAVVCAIGIAGWILPLFASGFQPHIAALTLLLITTAHLMRAYSQAPSKRWQSLLVAGLATAGMSFVWVYLLPIGALAILVSLVHTLRARGKVRPPIYFIASALVLAAGAAFPLVVQATHPQAGGGFDAHGYIPDMLPMYPLIGIFLIISLYAYLRKMPRSFWINYGFAALSLLFAIVVMRYQIHKLHEVRYYYYKATYTYVIYAVILLAAVIGYWLQQALVVKPRFGRLFHTGLIISVFIAVSSMYFISFKSSHFDLYYHRQAMGIKPEQAMLLSDLLHQDLLNGLRYAPIGSCDAGFDIRASLLAHALAWTPSSYKHASIVMTLTSPNEGLVFWQINLYLQRYNQPLYVISSDMRVTTALKQYIADKNPSRQQLVQYYNIDADPPATVLADCPGRLGSVPVSDDFKH